MHHEAKSLLEQIFPVAGTLSRLQSDQTSIVDASATWLDLLDEKSLQHLPTITGEHHSAYIFHHPKYISDKLTKEQNGVCKPVSRV